MLVIDDPEWQLDPETEQVRRLHLADGHPDGQPEGQRACPEFEPLSWPDLARWVGGDEVRVVPAVEVAGVGQHLPDPLRRRIRIRRRADVDLKS